MNERMYTALEAADNERDALRREWERKHHVCPECGIRDGLHEEGCSRYEDSDAYDRARDDQMDRPELYDPKENPDAP